MDTKEIQIKSSYLSFLLNKEIFAVNVQKVLEVLEKQTITPVPDTPKYIRGVLNFRGEILPILETRLKFNMHGRDKDKFVIIVLDLSSNGINQLIGAIVDSVEDVLEFSDNNIKEMPEMGSSYRADYIRGMIKSENGFIMILDIHKVFSQQESEILSDTIKEKKHIKISNEEE